MIWLVIGFLAPTALAALWHYLMKPLRHRHVPAGDLSRCVWSLAVQMSSGSTLIAEREPGPGFLQFALLSAEKNWAELEFGLPDIDWSTSHFLAVDDSLRVGGFHPAIEDGVGAVSRFLRVRLAGTHAELRKQGQDIADITIRALDWHNPSFTVRYEGGLRPSASRGG